MKKNRNFMSRSPYAAQAAAAVLALAVNAGGILAPQGYAADQLIVETGPNICEETVTLDGELPGTVNINGTLAVDGTAVNVIAGKNSAELLNAGTIEGEVRVGPDAVLLLDNVSNLGKTGQEWAVNALPGEEGGHGGANKVTINNYGNINGGVGFYGDYLSLNNIFGKITTDTGPAVQVLGGNAKITLDDSTVRTGDSDGAAILIGGSEEDAGGPGGEAGDGAPAPRPAAVELSVIRTSIIGNIENHGTLNIIGYANNTLNGDIINGGAIHLGANNVSFNGDYIGGETVAADGAGGEVMPAARSSLSFSINDNGHGSLNAAGDADISTTDIIVDANGGLAGESYKVITAGGVLQTVSGDADAGMEATSVTVKDNSVALNYDYILSPGTNGSVAVRASAAPGAFAGNSGAADSNMGAAFDAIAAAPGNTIALNTVMRRLNAIQTTTAMTNAMQSVNNRVSANSQSQLAVSALSAHTAAVKDFLHTPMFSTPFASTAGNDILARQSAGGRPAGAGATGEGADFYRWNTFARLYGGFGAQDNTASSAGYDLSSLGVLAGLDYAFAREFRFGVLGGYSYNHSKINQKLGKNTDLLARLGFYSALNWDGAYIDIAPTFGLHRLESERNIMINGWGTQAKSERWAWDVNMLVNAGLTIHLPAQCYFIPEFSLNPGVFHSPEFSEHGAADNLNLWSSSHTSWSLLQTMNFKFGTLIDLGGGTRLKPEFNIGWEHEYLDTAGETTNAFTALPNVTWRNTLHAIDRDRLLIGLGLNALINDDLTVYGRWEQRIWGGGYTASFSAGIGLGF